jgi:hypothetical protein
MATRPKPAFGAPCLRRLSRGRTCHSPQLPTRPPIQGGGRLIASARGSLRLHMPTASGRRQNSVRRHVIDLAGLIQRKSRLDDHHPAPPASTASPPLRRSPPCCPGEPGLAPPAHRLQEDGDPAEGAQERPTLPDRAVAGVGGLEAGSRHRVTQNRPAVAAAPLLRALDQALRPAHPGPPTRQC